MSDALGHALPAQPLDPRHAGNRLRAALADRYRVERELGAGGMATVYLAEDLKHKRKVALKVLKPELAAVLGAERFVQEITTTASLQHPHILPLFDSGTADGFLYYVMPFIEGETLRDKLNRETQLGVDEAVRVAREVADALHYAHQHGVIHRDIKPENILIQNGRPMVADFGIALALSAAAGGRMTETGLSLGTPHYMSPEQATAEKEISARSDVYSLASVLYEMLTGSPPHVGSSAQQIIMRIITEAPRPVTELRKSVPSNVAAAVAKALEKLPADRFESAAAFGAALGNAAFTTAGPAALGRDTAGIAPRTLGWPLRVAAGLAALVIVTIACVAGRAGAAGPDVIDVGLPDTAQLALSDDGPWSMEWPALAVAPSGDFIVYVARVGTGTELWYRSLRGPEARPLPGTRGALQPVLSPDGRWVAFQAGRLLKKVSVGGDSPAVDVTEVIEPFGITWTGADEVLAATNYGTSTERIRMSDGGKRSRGGSCGWPTLVPGTDDIICHTEGNNRHARVVRLRADGSLPQTSAADMLLGDSVRPMPAAASALVGDQLLFVDEVGNLVSVQYDRSNRTIGPRRIVQRGLRRSQFAIVGHFGVTRGGDLVYVPGSNGAVGQFVSMRPGGSAHVLPIPAKEHYNFTVSRDGKWLAASSRGVTAEELWIYDPTTGQGDRVAAAFHIGYPSWAPDGALAFAQRATAVSEMETMLVPSGGGTAVRLAGLSFRPSAFVNRNLLVGTSSIDVVAVTLDGDRIVRADTLKLPNNQYYPVVSADGRWLAYAGAERGISQVFVTPFPSMDRQYKSSVDAASEPLWLPDGSLVYRTGKCWYRQRPRADAMPPLSAPALMDCDERLLNASGPSNAVMPDGSILYVRTVGPTTAGYVRIVRRWQRTLGRAGADEGRTQ